MPSLDETIKDLQQRLQYGRELGGTGTEPIYYLVFPVSEILLAKRKLKLWKSQLELQNWDVVVCSMQKLVQDVFQNDKHRAIVLEGEKKELANLNEGIQTEAIIKQLKETLTEGTEIIHNIQAALKEACSKDKGILIITDLEALHPFMRINSIEAKLQGLVGCPVVVFYPGKREGRTSLRFLEFYPPDPNYRSEHLG